MNKYIWILIGMLLLSISLADAKQPEVGDCVLIYNSENGFSAICYIGEIASIDDSLICLDVYFAFEGSTGNFEVITDKYAPNYDMCMSIDKITELNWKMPRSDEEIAELRAMTTEDAKKRSS